MSKGIKRIILDNQVPNVADLNHEGKILFELLTLIVDIKYRHKYGKTVANTAAPDYSGSLQTKDVLADQLPSVDGGLLGYNRREVSGNERQ